MDRKKTSATSSSKAGKKDENFLIKTAYSIRERVHELTDDVKEKTHNLARTSGLKKSKTQKKTDNKFKTPVKHPTAATKDSDSDYEDHTPSPRSPPSAATTTRRENQRDISKPNNAESKTSSSTTTTTITIPKTSADKLISKDLVNKSSDTSNNATVAPPPSPSSPSRRKSSGQPLQTDLKSTTGKKDVTKKPTHEVNNTDQIHVSFNDVSTVDDLLDRIDESIEKTPVIIENGKGTSKVNIGRTSSVPTPTLADVEKKPLEKSETYKNNKEEEPVHIQQAKHRHFVFENALNNSGSFLTTQRPLHTIDSEPLTPRISSDDDSSPISINENDDQSALPKSILKTSQDPSSLDTSTRTSSFQDEQIHVNIETIQGVDNLVDRVIDDVVHTIPSVVITNSQEDEENNESAWI